MLKQLPDLAIAHALLSALARHAGVQVERQGHALSVELVPALAQEMGMPT